MTVHLAEYLTETRRELRRGPVDARLETFVQTERQTQVCRYPLLSVTSDDEAAFVMGKVKWMLFFSVMPLLLLIIVAFFYPEASSLPITPN